MCVCVNVRESLFFVCLFSLRELECKSIVYCGAEGGGNALMSWMPTAVKLEEEEEHRLDQHTNMAAAAR